MSMLDIHDLLNIREDAHATRNDYREVYLVNVTVNSGSNYEPFTDSPYDISKSQTEYVDPTYTVYRTKARIKIIQDTTLMGLGPAVAGLEVGDYLMYFSDRDRATLEQVYKSGHGEGYVFCDGITLRMNNLTLNGVGRVFDVTAHCKKFSPNFRATGL